MADLDSGSDEDVFAEDYDDDFDDCLVAEGESDGEA